MNRFPLKVSARRRAIYCVLGLVAMVLVGGLGKTAILSVWLGRTEAALSAGKCDDQGLWGTTFFSSKSGCILFGHKIDSETFERYLANAGDSKAKGFVIDVLGWNRRSDMLPALRAIATADDACSADAVLSVVAIEEKVPFAGKDFAIEYYQNYSSKAVRLAKREKLPIRSAAKRIADDLASHRAIE